MVLNIWKLYMNVISTVELGYNDHGYNEQYQSLGLV